MIADQSVDSTQRAGAAGARLLPPAARRAPLLALACLCAWLAVSAPSARAASSPFIAPFTPNPPPLATTVPPNGDQNPYGIVTVARSVGALHKGDLLVSNFNNAGSPPTGNLQGTGTTIVQIPPGGSTGLPGTASVFAQIDPARLPGPCPGGVGLTTALAVTRSGFVIVGSLPTADGTSATAKAGCLLVLNSRGKVIETIAGGPINGPWDMTAVDHGSVTTLYVTNVLNATVANSPNVVNEGTVVRLRLLTIPDVRPVVLDEDVIATGFRERTDPMALVIGPTGVALGDHGTLYVADTLGNRIAAIPDATDRERAVQNGGRTVSVGGSLNGPLGLTLAPNDDIVTANSFDGNIVETTPSGAQVATSRSRLFVDWPPELRTSGGRSLSGRRRPVRGPTVKVGPLRQASLEARRGGRETTVIRRLRPLGGPALDTEGRCRLVSCPALRRTRSGVISTSTLRATTSRSDA